MTDRTVSLPDDLPDAVGQLIGNLELWLDLQETADYHPHLHIMGNFNATDRSVQMTLDDAYMLMLFFDQPHIRAMLRYAEIARQQENANQCRRWLQQDIEREQSFDQHVNAVTSTPPNE